MRPLGLVVLAGCWTAPTPVVTPPSPEPEPPKVTTAPMDLFAFSQHAAGPITMKTTIDFRTMQRLYADYRVEIDSDDTEDTSASMTVYDGEEKLLWIIPKDEEGLNNVQGWSPRVSVVGYPDLRPDNKLASAEAFTACECWGSQPTCYKPGSRIAINLETNCDGAMPEDMVGKRIDRVIWLGDKLGEYDDGADIDP